MKEKKFFFSYFLVDQKYYLFFYSQKSIDINFLYQSVKVIQELDFKQRKIRSLRGFFLHALEIMKKGKEYEILKTNLQPFFWKKVDNIIRQNKKAALQEFLFGSIQITGQDNKLGGEGSSPALEWIEEKIESLQKQVKSLQERIDNLETKIENPEYALRPTLGAPDETKTIQQDHYTRNSKRIIKETS